MKNVLFVTSLIACLLIHDSSIAAVNSPGVPQESTIRILVIADTRLSGAVVDDAIQYWEATWSNTATSTSIPTAIEIVNNGVPIALGPVFFSGTDEDQIALVRLFVEGLIVPANVSLRDFFGADVVVALSADIDNSCGAGPQENWIGTLTNFSAGANGLDLRESEGDYIAVAQLSGHVSCIPELAAHEFGHLLGAGHFEKPLGISQGLLTDSAAHRIGPFFGKYIITSMGAGPNTFDCPVSLPSLCLHADIYSDSSFGSNGRRNVNALDTTARSVANYRPGTGIASIAPACSDGLDNDGDSLVDTADPECTGPDDTDETGPPPPPGPIGCNPIASPPMNVSAALTDICDSTLTYSIYRLSWNDSCPGDFYLIEANQGFGTFAVGTVFGFSTPLFISGSPAAITVRACVDFSCSAQSNPPVFIFDQC